MEKYTLPKDLVVFGTQVTAFPEGVGAAFDAIMQSVPDGKNRSYYGLSNMDDRGKVHYYAAAEQKSPGEAEQYGYKEYTIPKGEYLTATVNNWKAKTNCIKDVFHEIMQDKRADCSKLCIEWYKNEEEMLCMLQTKPGMALFTQLDDAAEDLLKLLLPLPEEKLNTIPFKDSWTAAQLATHVTKSNKGIIQAMDMPGKPAGRKPDARVGELKTIFLDFTTKLKSPAFIVPLPGLYEKERMVTALKKSNQQLTEKRVNEDLSAVIEVPEFGAITKLELLHFVLYHTQRHIHQLKNIMKHL